MRKHESVLIELKIMFDPEVGKTFFTFTAVDPLWNINLDIPLDMSPTRHTEKDSHHLKPTQISKRPSCLQNDDLLLEHDGWRNEKE